VAELLRGVKEGRDVNLNTIKRDVRPCFPSSRCDISVSVAPLKAAVAGHQAAHKYALAKAPKLVEIMTAVPEEYRAVLIPQCVPPNRHTSLCPVLAQSMHACTRGKAAGMHGCMHAQGMGLACMSGQQCR
jgi:hypothetical protein